MLTLGLQVEPIESAVVPFAFKILSKEVEMILNFSKSY